MDAFNWSGKQGAGATVHPIQAEDCTARLFLFSVENVFVRGEARAKPRGVCHFTTKFEDLYILAKSVVAVTSKWSYRY